jgi:adenylate cyclase
VVNCVGDNVLAEFASAVDAVQGAWAIQQDLKARNALLPAARRMELRIGINVGDVLVQDDQLYGDGVNVAARMEAVADAGGICITGTVYDQVQNKGPLHYEYAGEQRVKNIVHPVRVYWVRMDTEARPQIPIGQPEQILHFSPFHLDVSNGCLWRGKKRIPLMPKDFAVLHTLTGGQVAPVDYSIRCANVSSRCFFR